MKYALAVDIGGTSTRAALVSEELAVEQRVQFPTDTEDPYAAIRKIAEAAASFEKKIEGAGVCCPGPLDLLSGTVLTPPNLHGAWHGLPLAEELKKAIGTDVYLENDANLAALAEAHIGAGRSCRIVQYFTVSTGFGAGLIIDRKIFRGAHGFANEVANTCMVNDGPAHGNIYPGGIEAIVSGTGIRQRAIDAGLSVRHAGEVNDLAKAGDPRAALIMKEAKIYLANYLAGVQAYTDPDIIILGGSVALKIPGFTEEVEQLVKERVYDVVRPYVRIRRSALNEDNGLLGAACLVFEKPGNA